MLRSFPSGAWERVDQDIRVGKTACPPYDTIGCASLRSAHPIKVTEIDNIVIAVSLSY